MTGVALAVGSTVVGLGTSVASSASAKSGAKKSASAQVAGNNRAIQSLFEQLMNSNNALQSGFNSNSLVQQGVLNSSLGYQEPYSTAGKTALQSLMGQIAPREARAESGTNPQEAARIQAAYGEAANKVAQAQQKLDAIKAQGQGLQYSPATAGIIAQLQQQGNAATVELQQAQQAQQQAQQAVNAITPYQAAQDAVLPQDATFSRQFTAQDYSNDPTTGGNAPPDLTKNFDTAGFLAKGGKTEGDLFRNFTMQDYQADPGYQFRLDQGNKALNNSAAARGGLLSGATLKAITDYNSGAASQEYGAAQGRFAGNQVLAQNAQNTAFNQFGQNRANAADVYQNAYSRWNDQNNTIFNRLSSLAGMGQTAATNQASYQQNYGSNMQDAQQNLSTGLASNYRNYGNNQATLLSGNGQALSDQATQIANANGSMYQGIGNAINGGITTGTGAYLQNASNQNDKDLNNTLRQYLLKSGAI